MMLSAKKSKIINAVIDQVIKSLFLEEGGTAAKEIRQVDIWSFLL